MLSKDKFYKRVRNSTLLEFVSEKAKCFNPNIITLAGLTFAISAALLFAYEIIFYAVIFVIISSFLDLLDGAVAKKNNKQTEFGGVLDSVSDRYSDAIVIAGIMLGYSLNNNAFWFLVGIFVIVGSIMVSYVRARGENAINEKVTIGIADRPMIIVLIIIGAIFGCMNYAILLLAILSNITVLQRIRFIYQNCKK